LVYYSFGTPSFLLIRGALPLLQVRIQIVLLFVNSIMAIRYREDLTYLNENQISKFLYAFEGIGAIFAGAFLIAYLSGLPTDVVYHSGPTLRMILSLFGGLLIILVIIGLLISALNKKKD
jgi:hypothetical protein